MGLELVSQIGVSFVVFFAVAAVLGTAAALGWI